jgi:hypothetical protein
VLVSNEVCEHAIHENIRMKCKGKEEINSKPKFQHCKEDDKIHFNLLQCKRER